MNTTLIRKNKASGYFTEQSLPVLQRKKSTILNRNISIDSQTRIRSQKKKSRSKSKKKKNGIHVAVIKAEDPKKGGINITSYFPRTKKEKFSKTNVVMRKSNLSASSRLKRVNNSDTSDDSPELKRSQCKCFHLFDVAGRKKRSSEKRLSSQEFTLLNSQDRKAQNKLKHIELQEELFETRNQLNQYRQVVYDMKKQLDKASLIQDKMLEQQEQSNMYLQKAEKYKAIAKEFRKEIENLKINLENDRKQQQEIRQREDQKKEIQVNVKKQTGLIINEMVISLQKMQMCSQTFDQDNGLINLINEMFQFVGTLHSITFQQENYNHQISSSDTLQDFQHLHSNQLSESQPNQLSGTHISNNSHLGELSQNIHHPCSQTQALNYSIFSPQFMISSDRNATQGLSNPVMHETDPNQMENFTLTWDHSNKPGNLVTQQSGISLQQQQMDLLMRIQQEMITLREQSSKVMEENRILKSNNEQLFTELSRKQKKPLSEAMEEIKQANDDLSRKIDNLHQSSSKERDISQIVQKYQEDNQALRDERQLAIIRMQNLEKSNAHQERMISILIQNRESNSNQSLGNSRSLQNFINNTEEESSQKDSNQPYIITNASQEHLSRQRNNSSIVIGFKENTSIDSSKNQNLRNRSFRGNLPFAAGNGSQSKIYQSGSIFLETGTHDKDKNLFSLSSTQQENVGILLQNKENFEPRHLDFDSQQQEQQLLQQSVFTLVKPENVVTISNQSDLRQRAEMIKIEDTLRYSIDPTTIRGGPDKSTINISTTNPLVPPNNPTFTQESNIMRVNTSEAQQSKYQQVNYTDSSDRSFSRHRYSNFDAKNTTQQLPIFNQDTMNSQETLQVGSLSHNPNYRHQNKYSHGVGEGGRGNFGKNTSSRKALTLINHSSSNDLVKRKSVQDIFKNRSPTFQSQYNNIGSDRENFNLQNIPSQNALMQDFSNVMFNYTGTLSHEEGPVSTQGNQQAARNFHEEEEVEDLLFPLHTYQHHLQFLSGQTSANNMSVRTINLKKEISSLDQEIMQLQNSLKEALNK